MSARLQHDKELLAPAWWLVVILAVVAGGAVTFGSAVTQRRAVEVLIYVILTVGLYVFAGNTGVLSFGHMAFMAVGAYVTALLTIPVIRKSILLPDLPAIASEIELAPAVAVPIAGLVACVLSAIIVVPICRLSGLAASLAMFAVLVIGHEVAVNWDSVTRGSQAMLGVPNGVSVGSALAWSVIAVVTASIYQGTSAGLRVRATRDDVFGAAAAGISTSMERIVPFLLSAFLIGVGGSLYAQVQGAFTPSSFYLEVTFLTIAMLVVGGLKSLAGAVIGSLIISIGRYVFENFETGFAVGSIDVPGRAGMSEVLLAALILLTLRARRDGLMQGRELVGRPGHRMRRVSKGAAHAQDATDLEPAQNVATTTAATPDSPTRAKG